ncbi:MAG: exodeoxyribonuclease I [Gammaproteobacteria bacterium]|nr:exodeoxyribonuclease I [Pseudomonadales bacterium]MCP5345814.1 exodeoxyribonuclease I [Pseudomonadales bacterium]
MTAKSIYWYDYETFGSDPRRDRAAQFAGLRTDENLQIIDEPLVIYCRPANDFLPSPQACLITGITPQEAASKGLVEAEFIARILAEFSRPGTCVAGYNSIRFDDELTRQLLYRNFFDPYEREWKDGNSRWDIIDMLRLCAAARPEGINWPRDDAGNHSFRLEALTAANSISHADAHDARADVLATIEMARLVRQHQPRLYDYVYQLRSKHAVEKQLDLQHRKPLIHVSSMYPASQGCLALVAPLCRHPVDRNGVIVYDLREDPGNWIAADTSEIRQRIFTRNEDLPAGTRRIPIKTLHINRCPIVAPPGIIDQQRAAELQIDVDQCQRHWQILMEDKNLPVRLREALEPDRDEGEQDPDFMIYNGGFFSEGDRKLMAVVRQSTPEQLAMLNLPFRDRRLAEMLFRYRARNFPDTLGRDELTRWESFRQTRLNPTALQQFDEEIQEARAHSGASTRSAAARVLDELEAYVAQLRLPSNE